MLNKIVATSLFCIGLPVGIAKGIYDNIPQLVAVGMGRMLDLLPEKKLKRPQYFELDKNGIERARPANCLGELDDEDRFFGRCSATEEISRLTGLKSTTTIRLDEPVYKAFEGMNRAKARGHQDAKLLLTIGSRVSLDYCPRFLKPREVWQFTNWRH